VLHSPGGRVREARLVVDAPDLAHALGADVRRNRKLVGHRAKRRGPTSSIAGVESRRVHHLGLAVTDLDEAIGTWERLFGARLQGRQTLESQGVEAALLLVGEGRIELLAPTGEDTPVGRFLARRGAGMHHVALEVDDVAEALDALSAEGAQLIDEKPRPGLFGLEVGFVHPDAVHGVLTEVVSSG
jgi:methylmalonyl-CoA epimerase